MWRSAAARAQNDAGELDIGAARRDDAHRAVPCGLQFERRPVGNQRVREVARDDCPQVASDDVAGRIPEVARVQSRGELAQTPVGDAA